MLDTVNLRYKTESGWVGDPEVRAFEGACVGPVSVGAARADGVTCEQSWLGVMPGVGPVKLRANGEVYFGRSLSKVYQEICEGIPADATDNGRILTSSECNTALLAWSEMAEGYMPFVDPDSWEVRRADIVYDRSVGNTLGVIRSLVGGVKPTRKGTAWFDNGQGHPTGVMFRGRQVVHRCYDKGLESNAERYCGVLRSEEQLRAGSRGLGLILDVENRAVRREECIDVLNERYLEVGYGESIDQCVIEMIENGEHTKALLVLHPELMSVYRGTVKRRGYFAMKKKVREVRASVVPVDLRVPEDAWLDFADAA